MSSDKKLYKVAYILILHYTHMSQTKLTHYGHYDDNRYHLMNALHYKGPMCKSSALLSSQLGFIITVRWKEHKAP